ncbi:ABC transporter permease [Marinobacter sp. JSM 1782161]|uniref:ABC transporter permease n=1 Tax=Marinobacter sp. JSM 1782161 TaxID=2685906 RepID=UPI001403ABB5|nr:ABC transporter permease [Marinobacter sp. JSM 1782161]
MLQLMTDLRRYRHALAALWVMDIKSTVASARLGWLWWFLDPLVMMMIYYFIIRVVFQRGGENYHLFVLCGIVSWQFFARSVSSCVGAITGKRGIIRQTSTPMAILIAVPCAVQFFFAAIGMAIVSLWSYSALGAQTLAIVPLLVLIFLLAYAVGVLMAVTQVFLADTAKFVGYLLRAGFFLSPVLYPASRVLEAQNVPEVAKTLFNLNPMAWVIESMRGVVLDGQLFNAWHWLGWMGGAILVLQLGLMYLRRSSNSIIKSL